MRLLWQTSVCLGVALALAGCQRVTQEKTISVPPGEIYEMTVDAPSLSQTVKVAASSSGAPVAVYLVLEQNKDAVKASMEREAKPDLSLVLAGGQGEQVDLSATVPAKKSYVVLIAATGGKKAEVKLQVTGG